MKRIFTLLAAFVVTLASCSKEAITTTNESTPMDGSISGTILPAGMTTSVVLTSNNDPKSSITIKPDANTGSFSAIKLRPGHYSIILIPKSGYSSSFKNITAEVTPGANTDVGVFDVAVNFDPVNSFTPDNIDADKSYSLSHKLNGDFIGYGAAADYAGSNLTITGKRSEGSYLKLNYKTYETTINVTGVTAPGTYAATISYVTTKNTIGYRTWGSKPAGGEATVLITVLDRVNKKISGTFSGKLLPVAGTAGNLILTEGKFNVFYK